VKKVSPVVENLGGKLERAILGFGDYDVVLFYISQTIFLQQLFPWR